MLAFASPMGQMWVLFGYITCQRREKKSILKIGFENDLSNCLYKSSLYRKWKKISKLYFKKIRVVVTCKRVEI